MEVNVGDIKAFNGVCRNCENKNMFKSEKLSDNRDRVHNIDWSDEQLELKELIKNGGYDNEHKERPRISRDYIIVDGYHRLTSLNHYYGSNYTVKVDILKHNFIKVFIWSIIYYLLTK